MSLILGLALLGLALSACAKEVQVQKPERIAYRITRLDGDQLIVNVPVSKPLIEIQREFCSDQTCILQVIKLK